MNIEADAARALGWFENHLPGHHETSAAQAAAAATTEEHMNIETALDEVVAEVKTIGGEVLGHAKAIAANPATVPALEWLSTLAGLNIDPAIITKAIGAIEALHIAYQPLVAQQAQAAAEAAQQAEAQPVQ